MKDTSSLLRPRSDSLKKVDEAVKGGNRDEIKIAIDRWRFEQSRQGKDWRKSVRNGKGAVTQLYRDVNDRRPMTAEEIEALKYIARVQALALQKQFDGKKLTFKPSTLFGMAKSAEVKWQRFKAGTPAIMEGVGVASSARSGVQQLRAGHNLLQHGGKAAVHAASNNQVAAQFEQIKGKVREFCRDLCPGIDPNHVFAALHLGGVEHVVQTITPFIGAISSGGKALAGWAKVAMTGYDRYKVAASRTDFAPGDPSAALEAVIRLIDREIASGSARAGVKTLAFTGKLLGTFADGGGVTGPAIGLLELLADIFQQVVEYVIEYKECKAANEMLRVGALNLDLFAASPVLGCYFLVVQDHSTIINFALGDYGSPNFMFDVEELVKRVGTALEKARFYLSVARYEIVGMDKAKGVVGPNFAKKGVFDKIAGAKEEVQDRVMGSIDDWLLKPEKPPKVDKARIVGLGSTP